MEKMTKIDLMIKRMILEYPRLFPSRVECWIHLFTNYGTGREWNLETGELESLIEEKKEYPTKPKLVEIEPDDNEVTILYKNRINLLIQYNWDNIDLIVKDYLRSTQERDIHSLWSLNWCDPDEEYQHYGPMQEACRNRDKISKEWRYEMSYFCDWITREIRCYIYSPSKKDRPTNEEILQILSQGTYRRMRELKNAFYAATKVLENIFTDEEKKKHRKNEEEMIKFTNELIEEIEKDKT